MSHINRMISAYSQDTQNHYKRGPVAQLISFGSSHRHGEHTISLFWVIVFKATWQGTWSVFCELTHWGRGMHIWGNKLTIIGSDNGFSPGRRQAIIWAIARILLIRPLGTNFNEMLIKILTFSFMKMRLKVSSATLRPFCLGLNVLKSEQMLTFFLSCRVQNVVLQKAWRLLHVCKRTATCQVSNSDIIDIHNWIVYNHIWIMHMGVHI